MNAHTPPETYDTEDLLISLCNSVTHVLGKASHSQIHYSAMVQRITKTLCLVMSKSPTYMHYGKSWLT